MISVPVLPHNRRRRASAHHGPSRRSKRRYPRLTRAAAALRHCGGIRLRVARSLGGLGGFGGVRATSATKMLGEHPGRLLFQLNASLAVSFPGISLPGAGNGGWLRRLMSGFFEPPDHVIIAMCDIDQDCLAMGVLHFRGHRPRFFRPITPVLRVIRRIHYTSSLRQAFHPLRLSDT